MYEPGHPQLAPDLWVPVVSNPGLYSRGRYGPGYLYHRYRGLLHKHLTPLLPLLFPPFPSPAKAGGTRRGWLAATHSKCNFLKKHNLFFDIHLDINLTAAFEVQARRLVPLLQAWSPCLPQQLPCTGLSSIMCYDATRFAMF